MKKTQVFLIAAAFVIPSFGFASPAPYSTASFVGNAEAFGINVAGSVDFGTRYQPTNYGYVDVTTNPLPSVTLNATAPNGPQESLHYIDAAASLIYYFSVSGPDTTIPIPVNISGKSILDARSGDLTGQLRSGLVVGAGTLFQFNGFCAKSIVDVSGICGETDFSGQVDAFALPNADYSIQLSVGVYGQFGGGGNAYIDPFLEIDPAWSVDHPGYSLAVSEGFGNEPLTPSAVPEPSSCALVLSGLALIGAVNRRRTLKDALPIRPKVVTK